MADLDVLYPEATYTKHAGVVIRSRVISMAVTAKVMNKKKHYICVQTGL